MRDYEISSDLKQSKFENLKFVQGDTGSKIIVNLFEDSQAVNLANCTVLAKFKRADGYVDKKDATVTNNIITVEIDDTATAIVGTLKLIFEITYETTKKASTFMLLADISEGIGSKSTTGGGTGDVVVDVDLSNYYTKSEVNSLLNNIANELGRNEDGTEIELPTTDKTIKGAIAEVFQSVSNGKTLVANAITDKGVNTLATDTFQTMATNISKISGVDGAIVQIKGITYKLSVDSNGTVIATKTAGVEGLIEGRILLWNDDFEGTEVNSEYWTFDDRDKYGALLNSWTGGARTTVKDSILNIKAKKETYGSYTAEWSSDELWTRKKYANNPCRFEAKIKFDVANGCFPAFWLMGNYFSGAGKEAGDGGLAWSTCGEVDIMECMKGKLSSNIHWSNLENKSDNSIALGDFTSKVVGDLTDWHIYGCEITDTQIIFDVDGIVHSTWNISDANADFGNAFKHPMYVLLSMQVGASAGTPDDNITEMNMFVDWVRCYAPIDTTVYGEVESMQITGIDTTVVPGVTQVATVKFTPAIANNKILTYSSSNENVATIKNGVITSIADGETTITVTANNGVSASIKFTVESVAQYPVTALAFDKTSKPIVVGNSYTPNLTITPDYTTDNIVYSSSNTDVFTVNSSTGQITAIASGSGVLTVTADSGVIATMNIEIIASDEQAYIDAHYNATKYQSDTGIGNVEKLSNSFKYSLDARDDDYTFVMLLSEVDRGASLGFMASNAQPATTYKPVILSSYNEASSINNIKIYGESSIGAGIEFTTITTTKIALVVKQKVMYYYKDGSFVTSQNIKSANSAIKSGTTNLGMMSRATTGTAELMLYRRALSEAEAIAITTL